MKFLIVLVSLVAATLASALSSSSPREEDPVRREGVMTGWHMDMDGTLFLRLKGVDPALEDAEEQPEAAELWFRSPPDQSSIIKVEQLLLPIILAREGTDPLPELTVYGERERENDGSSREEAISMLSLGVH